MYKRFVGFIIISNIMFSILIPTIYSEDNTVWWDEDWDFRQQIDIPINTNNEQAKFQPIDISIEFKNTCWAKNEKEHSIRVVFQQNEKSIELESQIYDLNNTNGNSINSCNLVFLIPKEANGKETYYIYYDDNEKTSTNYDDHVAIEDSRYLYEPVQGLPFESRYFKITEEDNIIYAVAKDGKFLSYDISQEITKLKPESKTVEPKNGDQLASFYFTYWWKKNGVWCKSSTVENLESSKIFVDGELMVKFGIVSKSSDNKLKTTVIYKYYYCPNPDKRIYTHVKHEVLGKPLLSGEEIDVLYLKLTNGLVRSSVINDLNFGKIPSYLHVYNQDERVKSYDIDPYPEEFWETWIRKEDNCDLGSKAWISIDEGDSGKAHSIIFGSNKIIKKGENEEDGISVQMYGSKDTELPGFDARFVYVYLGRNSYEPGKNRDEELPNDLCIEFDAEFFSTENGGYKRVMEEANMYQSLIRYQPKPDENVTNDEEPKDEYSLTVYSKLSGSLASKLLFSILSGKKSYVCVELYQDGNLFSSARASRFVINEDLKIDWKNFSLIRKTRFSHILAGKYLIKIWLENPIFGDKRELIGIDIINLQSDTDITISCSPEGSTQISILDQYNSSVETALVRLIKDDMIIAENNSNHKGEVEINVPCSSREEYTLNVIYKGFLVHEDKVKIGYIRKFFPLKIIINVERYNLNIKIRDGNGEIPTYNIDIFLKSSDMIDNNISISTDFINKGIYEFIDIYPANYSINIIYKSFIVEETVNIHEKTSIFINFSNLKVKVKDEWNIDSEVNLDVVLSCKEFNKPIILSEQLSHSEYLFTDLYPAEYLLKLSYLSFVLEKPITISNSFKDDFEVKFPALFNLTMSVFDTRGNRINDAEVIVTRGELGLKEFSKENGKVIFKLPPGIYSGKIYSDDILIAERKIDIRNEKNLNVVTTKEPLIPFIIIGLAICLVILAFLFTYKNRNIISFMKILAIVLAIIAVVSPWWMIYGSSSSTDVETSTTLFLLPTELVTLTSSPNVIAGDLALLDETFTLAMNILSILILLGCMSIISSMILKQIAYPKISFLLLVFSIIFFIISIIILLYGVSQLVETGVGSLIGSLDIDVSIPGENKYETIPCSWGPGIGFYIFLISLVLIIIPTGFNIRKLIIEKL